MATATTRGKIRTIIEVIPGIPIQEYTSILLRACSKRWSEGPWVQQHAKGMDREAVWSREGREPSSHLSQIPGKDLLASAPRMISSSSRASLSSKTRVQVYTYWSLRSRRLSKNQNPRTTHSSKSWTNVTRATSHRSKWMKLSLNWTCSTRTRQAMWSPTPFILNSNRLKGSRK